MAQDTTQLIATARGYLTSMAYSADERPVLVAIVDQLERTHAALSAIMEHAHVPTLGQTNRPDDDALDSHLPEQVRGARRCGIQRSAWLPSFFVGWSPRNDNENAEGPWSDWVKLAHAILAADAVAQNKLQGEAL